MKRQPLIIFLMVLFLVLCCMSAPSQAKDQNITFEWEQTLTPDFQGWKIWVSNTQGGPYTQFGQDIIYDGTPAPTYQSTEILTAPDGAETTFYFVCNAWDKSGNASGDSNEVAYTADFLAPGVPVKFTVTVQPSP